MSRNPILTDKAFDPANYGGTTVTQRLSPAQEWEQAQRSGSTQAPPAPTLSPTPQRPPMGGDTRPQAPTGPIVSGRTMTIGGTAWATLLFLVVAGIAGVFGWSAVTETPVLNPAPGAPTVTATLDQPVLLFVALFGALGLAILTAFKPKLARFTGFGYALARGLSARSHLAPVRRPVERHRDPGDPRHRRGVPRDARPLRPADPAGSLPG